MTNMPWKFMFLRKKCIDHNRPLFGFIPIYGLKSRFYDIKNNAECTDLLLLHKKFSFLLDFDMNSVITSEKVNHKSALNYPDHVKTYLQEEILCPLKDSPIVNLVIS